jgi:hypothetical protein
MTPSGRRSSVVDAASRRIVRESWAKTTSQKAAGRRFYGAVCDALRSQNHHYWRVGSQKDRKISAVLETYFTAAVHR